MRNLTYLLFVAATFICWGTYGPTLHQGQTGLGADGEKSLLRPIICVGVSYFLIAVLYPLAILLTTGEKGKWSVSGFFWSFIAGAMGAFGALGIALAFKYQGKPIYVMPLVFGCAPIMNTLVTMLMAKTFRQAKPLFFVGVLIVALGAAGVLIHKPTGAKPASQVAATVSTPAASQTLTSSQMGMVVLGIAITAICWGGYGPVLHKGQAKMDGSRLRPFLCVGLAYFVIAVIVPYFMLNRFPEPGTWHSESGMPNAGVWWSLGAGVLGALGALGIIYAFNFGGKPIFVMPLVFGFAPVINTLVETTSKGLLGEIKPMFFASLGAVILGAIMVLVFAPKSAPPTKPRDASQSENKHS